MLRLGDLVQIAVNAGDGDGVRPNSKPALS